MQKPQCWTCLNIYIQQHHRYIPDIANTKEKLCCTTGTTIQCQKDNTVCTVSQYLGQNKESYYWKSKDKLYYQSICFYFYRIMTYMYMYFNSLKIMILNCDAKRNTKPAAEAEDHK